MLNRFMVLLCVASLSACGLAETAATGATGASVELEAAQQAQQTEQRAQQQLEAARKLADKQLQSSEEQSNQ